MTSENLRRVWKESLDIREYVNTRLNEPLDIREYPNTKLDFTSMF